MSAEWDRPITKPLPGPVASESAQMSVSELARVVTAGSIAAHVAAGHVGDILDCAPCLEPVYPPRPPIFPVVE